MANNKITKEMILQAEHDLMSEVSVWEYSKPKEAQKLAFYNDGIHDMASKLLTLLEDDDGE